MTAPPMDPQGPSDAGSEPKSMDERFRSILAQRNRQVRATEAAARQAAARQARIASQRQITVEDVHAVADMAPPFPARITVPIAGNTGRGTGQYEAYPAPTDQPGDPLLDDPFVGYRGRVPDRPDEEDQEMDDPIEADYHKRSGGSRNKTAGTSPAYSRIQHFTTASGAPIYSANPAGKHAANHSAPPLKPPSASASKAATAAAAAAAAALAGSRAKRSSSTANQPLIRSDPNRSDPKRSDPKPAKQPPPARRRSSPRASRSPPRDVPSPAGRTERPGGSGNVRVDSVPGKSGPPKRASVKSRLRVPVHMRLSLPGSVPNSSPAAAAAAAAAAEPGGAEAAAGARAAAADAPLRLVSSATGILPPPHARSLVPALNAFNVNGMVTFHPSLPTPFVAAPAGPLLPQPVLVRTIPVPVGGLVRGPMLPFHPGLAISDHTYRFGAGRVGGQGGEGGKGYGLGRERGGEKGRGSVASKAALDDEIDSYMVEKYAGKGGRA
ncbi:hypothetical protein CLOM_g13706 [Closterium sp. NIES-68]|nr:hypothetical protein CLOM_g13706 [Closterium sp. NIES-68]GJP73495.1 hypothetical protein CLOP_g4200 [Closterium sp. NIES-67]